MDPFKEVIPALFQKRLNGLPQDMDQFEAGYGKCAFIINRYLSQFKDYVPYAYEANLLSAVDPKMQFDYLFHSIPKGKVPYSKWAKGEKSDINNLIAKAYSVSYSRAEEMARLISDEDIEQLKAFYDVGGRSGK